MTSSLLVFGLLLLQSTGFCEGALTEAEKQELVDIHNTLRASEGSSNMQKLKWNNNLEYMAQDWSDRCVFKHGQGLNSTSLADLNVGQNLFSTSGKNINLTAAVLDWYNETAFYSYTGNSCKANKTCGHYTQVVWAESNQLGCGYTACPNMIMLTCNYGPAGNYVGAIPYRQGPACTQCNSGKFFCDSGLCESSCTSASTTCECKAACKNCGKITEDCKCQCGKGWTGVDCSEVCQNNHKYCGGNPGWPRSWCGQSKYSYVSQNCPAFCGACVAGTPEPCL